MKLSEAVRGVSGTLAADGEFSCIAFATEQEQSQFLTFLEKEKFLPALDNSKISCVLTTSALAEKIPPHIKGVFLCDRPKAALFEIHNNMDFRVCGRADSVLSQIILDNTSAAEQIPKDARGRFITGDGTVFQGYLFDEERF